MATPADAALMMQMGVDGVFVGSGIFKSGDPAKRARAIVQVSKHDMPCSGIICRHHYSLLASLQHVQAILSVLSAALQAVTHYNDPNILAEVSCGLGVAMVGIDCRVEGFQSYAARSE